MKKLTKKAMAEIQAAVEADDQMERAKHATAPICRGLRGQVGANPSDDVSKAVEKMIGATIVDAGFVQTCREGGLAFDFDKDGKKMRLVIGYNDLGEWVEFLDERKA